MKRGLKARDAGALEAAVRAQWRGAFHAPFFAHSWRHLGNALLRSAAYDLSCEYAVEARHALSLAYFHLRDAHAGKGLQALDAIGELGDCYVEMELDKAENTALHALAALDGDQSQASLAADAVATTATTLAVSASNQRVCTRHASRGASTRRFASAASYPWASSLTKKRSTPPRR